MRTRRILLSIPHTARAAYCFTRQLMLLAWEVWVVFFFMKVLDGRSLPDDHAWETGKTQDGDDIWPRNIVYRSPSKFEETIRASGGRGGQCRAAAEATDADIIVFIHADARVTPGARRAIEAKLARGHRIAMFRQRTPRSSLVYRLLDMMTAVDSVFTRFGDQGIIVTRDFYDELGGMPEYRLFEDYAFLRKARRRTRIPRISSDLRVSPRRFEKEGLFKQLLFGLTLQLRYLTGADPDELHRRYYGQEEAA